MIRKENRVGFPSKWVKGTASLSSRATLSLVLFTMCAVPLYCTAGAKQPGGGGSNPSGQGQPTQSNQPNPGGGASGPFESQMLAYGSLDRVLGAIADRTCNEAKNAGAASTILVLDQASLANLAAYDAFVSTVNVLTNSFGGTVAGVGPAGAPGAAPGGTDVMADIVSAVSAVLIASNSETASNFPIQDPSAGLILTEKLKRNGNCTGATVVYANMVPTPSASDVTLLYEPLTGLATARTNAFKNVPAASLTNLDTTYAQFLQSLFATGTNGQPGIISVLQGYNLRKVLNSKKPTFSVVVNVAAAGGTQQVRKNLLTALITGEWIRYSGGVVVNALIARSDTGTLIFTDTLRYRSPLATIGKPKHGQSTKAGDNLEDTCEPSDHNCPLLRRAD